MKFKISTTAEIRNDLRIGSFYFSHFMNYEKKIVMSLYNFAMLNDIILAFIEIIGTINGFNFYMYQ